MEFVSPVFLIFFIAGFIMYRRPSLNRHIGVIIPLLNISFIIMLARSMQAFISLAIFIGAGYLCMKWVEARRQKAAAAVSIALMTILLIAEKKYPGFMFVPAMQIPFFVIGVSYMYFRNVHLIVDSYTGALNSRMSILRYFTYICFFPCFVSGPIQRYEDFARQFDSVREASPVKPRLYEIAARVVNGYLKATVLSLLCLTVHKSSVYWIGADSAAWAGMLAWTAACGAYTLYIYFNFSGYMDIVIGLGRLFGFDVPENFNHPFASKSFVEFWSRWHITLSAWFRFYVFNPVSKYLFGRCPDSRLYPYLGCLAYLITFFLMGIWHGSASRLAIFTVFGLFLGVGISVNRLFEIELKKRLSGTAYSSLSSNKAVDTAGRALTLSYFCVSLTCFWIDPQSASGFVSARGAATICAVFSSLAVFIFLWICFVDAVRAVSGGFKPLSAFLYDNTVFKYAVLDVKLCLLILFLVLKSSSVESFIYGAF